METILLTNELGLQLAEMDNKTIDGVEYRFDVSTFKRNDKKIVNQVVIFAFIDGDWEEELSNTYHVGETITGDENPWISEL